MAAQRLDLAVERRGDVLPRVGLEGARQVDRRRPGGARRLGEVQRAGGRRRAGVEHGEADAAVVVVVHVAVAEEHRGRVAGHDDVGPERTDPLDQRGPQLDRVVDLAVGIARGSRGRSGPAPGRPRRPPGPARHQAARPGPPRIRCCPCRRGADHEVDLGPLVGPAGQGAGARDLGIVGVGVDGQRRAARLRRRARVQADQDGAMTTATDHDWTGLRRPRRAGARRRGRRRCCSTGSSGSSVGRAPSRRGTDMVTEMDRAVRAADRRRAAGGPPRRRHPRRGGRRRAGHAAAPLGDRPARRHDQLPVRPSRVLGVDRGRASIRRRSATGSAGRSAVRGRRRPRARRRVPAPSAGAGATRNGAADHVLDRDRPRPGPGGHRVRLRPRAPGAARPRCSPGDRPRSATSAGSASAALDLCSVACGRVDALLRAGPGALGLRRRRPHRRRGRRRGQRPRTADRRRARSRWPPPPALLEPLVAGRCSTRRRRPQLSERPHRAGIGQIRAAIRHDGAVGTRILTVEDDERIRTAVKMALEDEGWTVEEADNGEDALEHVQPPPDRRRADRHHAARHRRLRGVPVDPPRRATCRSSWSPPGPTPTTWSPASRPGPTTTSPSRSPPRSCRPASGPCCGGPAPPTRRSPT